MYTDFPSSLSSCLESDVADFDGRSSLLYRFNQKLMSTLKDVISLKFKSMQGDGVLFHGEGQRGDHITLELQRGRLALHLNLGRSSFAPSLAMPGCRELLLKQVILLVYQLDVAVSPSRQCIFLIQTGEEKSTFLNV